MPTALDILLARTRGDLPPVPGPAPSAPIPLAPVTGIGPLSDDTTAAFAALNPEPVPPAMATAPPLDTNFINSYSGAAPVAPTLQEPSFLDKLSTALLGFGAGFQGRGPQYIESVREERNRPIREYQRQLEQYNERRTRGTEIATRQQEREQDRAQQAAQNQYEREFQIWLKKTGARDEQTKERARRTFELEKEARRTAAEERERIAKEIAAKEKQRGDIATKLITQDFAPQKVANEIADAIVFGKPLSVATEKWRSVRARKMEASLNPTGGSAASAKYLVTPFDPATGTQYAPIPVERIRYTSQGQLIGFPQGTQFLPPGGQGGQAPQPAQQFQLPSLFPPLNPFETPTQPPAAPKLTRTQAKGKLVKEGYSSKEADAELDRLGIK